MKMIRAALFAIGLLSAGSVYAQVPAPVPALPDAERRVQYSPSASVGPFSISFALFGSGTDYGNWVEVWLNGVRLTPVTDFTVTLTSGTLATSARPLTNAQVTLVAAGTGTLQIVGAERPRRLAQFAENAGVSARNLNLAITDLVAQNRETWDKINDVTGRGLFSQPGVTLGPLPLPAACASKFLGFDATGLIPMCLAVSGGGGGGGVNGLSPTVIGHFATWADTTGTLIQDFNLFGTPTTWTAPLTLSINQNASTQNIVTNTSTGVSASSRIQFNNSVNAATVGIASTGYTDLPILQNRGFLSSAVGVAVNAGGANPIVLGINNTEVARFGSDPVLQLTPAAASNSRGLLITQSGPTSGTATGPISLNLISATHGAGSATAGQDAFSLFNTITAASRLNYEIGGASLGGVHVGFLSALRSTSANTSGDKIALFGNAYTNFNEGATGYSTGVVGVAGTGTSATIAGIFGAEFAVYGLSGATITDRAALNLANYGSAQGATVDTAILVLSGPTSIGATSAGAFRSLIRFSNLYNLTPMDTAAKLIVYDHPATIADFVDFSTSAVTITGNIISTPTLTIAGSSLTTLNAAGIGVTPTDRLVLRNATAAAAGVQQMSPSLHFIASGWKTNATAAAQVLDWRIQNTPTQDAINPITTLSLSAQVNALGYNDVLSLRYNVNGPTIAFFNSAATQNMAIGLRVAGVAKWYMTNYSSSDYFVLGNSDANGNVSVLTVTQDGGLLVGPIGTPNPLVKLTINANAVQLSAPFAGTFAQFGQVDGSPGILAISGFGTGAATAYGGINLRRANGTAAAPSANQVNDILGIFGAHGYLATAYDVTNRGQFRFVAAETYTDSAAGTHMDVYTTAIGTLTTSLMARFQANTGLTIGSSSTAPALAGSIRASGWLQSGESTVAGLPTCDAAARRAKYFVTDANATLTAGIGAVVAAGGANNVPVVCDGTNWRIGANDNMPENLRRKFA